MPQTTTTTTYLILDNGKPTQVHHNAKCRVFTDGHEAYRVATASEGKRPCRYCGGGAKREPGARSSDR